MRTMRLLAVIVLIIGGLNWGLIGLASLNLVDVIFGTLSRVIYVVVGLAAIYAIFDLIAAEGQQIDTPRGRHDL